MFRPLACHEIASLRYSETQVRLSQINVRSAENPLSSQRQLEHYASSVAILSRLALG